jgi:predicted transcriptional regulator
VATELDIAILLKSRPLLSTVEIAESLNICQRSAERWLKRLHTTRQKKSKRGRGNPAWLYSLELPPEKLEAIKA